MNIISSFNEQSAVIERAGGTPRRIIFSGGGFLEAKRRHYTNFSFASREQPFSQFMGLPYEIDYGTKIPIAVLDYDQPRRPVSFRCDQADPFKTNMEIAGQLLTRAQLSDLIQAWADAHPNEPGSSGMLREWLEMYGRFE